VKKLKILDRKSDKERRISRVSQEGR